MSRGIRGGWVWIAPAILVLTAVEIFPLGYAAWVSLHEWSLLRPLDISFVGLSNFISLARDPALWKAVGLSLGFTVLAVSLQLVLGLALAVFFSHRPRLFGSIRALLLVPIFLTPVVAGTMWRLMIHPELGIVNYYLGLLGIPGVSWLADGRMAFLSVTLLDLWRNMPFMLLVLHAGLLAIPPELYDAADVDGASGWQVFRHVTLPQLRYVILVAVLIRTMDAFREFDSFFVVTGGGPGTATEVLQLMNYRVFSRGHIGLASALAVVSLLITVVISGVLRRSMTKDGEPA